MTLPCLRCGEPYDVETVDCEFTDEERVMFLKGDHCPSCRESTPVYTAFPELKGLYALLRDDLNELASRLKDIHYTQ